MVVLPLSTSAPEPFFVRLLVPLRLLASVNTLLRVAMSSTVLAGSAVQSMPRLLRLVIADPRSVKPPPAKVMGLAAPPRFASLT